jgi:diketogulonate reductase-like aldo/keto reductase
VTPSVPVRTLRNGVRMPLLGLGVWQLPDGPACEQAVRWALEAGYRHVDTARLYGNEESVGRALREGGVPREELFVTTKLLPRVKDGVRALEGSLRRLGLDHVDLYLVHWPTSLAERHWRDLETLHARGLARAIGVSNWGLGELGPTLASADVVPHVDQVQFSPFTFRRRLLEACEEHGIALEAYSPLVRGRRLDHPEIARVAARHGRTPAQVLLRWALERGVAVIPKSSRRERIEENAQVFDFALGPEDLAALDALDTTGGTSSAR